MHLSMWNPILLSRIPTGDSETNDTSTGFRMQINWDGEIILFILPSLIFHPESYGFQKNIVKPLGAFEQSFF